MNDKEFVKLDELKEIAVKMREKKDILLDIYEKKIKQILYKSNLCITKSGGNYEEIESTYNDLISQFDYKMTDLDEFLINKVIPSYEYLSTDIKNIFNHDFADKMQNLLDMEK